MKTILGAILSLLTCTAALASGANVGTEVPYPVEWSQPRILANGTIVPPVPTRFATGYSGVQFQPTAVMSAGAPAPAQPAPDTVPLISAADRGDLKTVQALVAKKADVNQANVNGATALMAAAAGGHLDVVKFLLTNGAHVNDVTKSGKTALSYAAQKGQLKVVQLLMQSKADPMVMDESGKMAVDYATAGKFTNVVAALKGELTPAKK